MAASAVVRDPPVIARICRHLHSNARVIMERYPLGDGGPGWRKDDLLASFAAWQRHGRLAPDHQVSFFVRLVERYLRLSKARPGEVWRDTPQIFLENLAEGQTPDWQIRQASGAVGLFCGQFPRPKGASPQPYRHLTPAGVDAAVRLRYEPALTPDLGDIVETGIRPVPRCSTQNQKPVEAAGIEPASGRDSSSTSTCVAHRLSLAR